MSGLALSKRYFVSCRPALAAAFPDLFERMCVGLIGHGSQCLGFDDEQSRDHDWGPEFCVFLDRSDFDAYGAEVQTFLEKLPSVFEGYPVEWDKRQPRERSGALCTQDWFYEQLGVLVPIREESAWLRTSDPKLRWVTNGEIWHDPLGRVTEFRKDLAYYPEEAWRKRVANKALLVQILGPYQIERAIQRGDRLLPFLSRTYFVRESLHLVFLLNGEYAPFFKWLLRAFEELPDNCGIGREMLDGILRESDEHVLLDQARQLASQLHGALQRRFPDITNTENPLHFGFRLSDTIENEKIRNMPFWHQELVA